MNAGAPQRSQRQVEGSVDVSQPGGAGTTIGSIVSTSVRRVCRAQPAMEPPPTDRGGGRSAAPSGSGRMASS